MPRKKRQSNAATIAGAVQADTGASTTAVAEPESKDAASPMTRPEYIDGPPVNETGDLIAPRNPEARNWGDPYKAIFTSTQKGFEMGENRRFKQRVFKFAEKPADEVIAALKEAGFTYRANEKAWTIQATPEARRISEDLAHQFAGQGVGLSR